MNAELRVGERRWRGLGGRERGEEKAGGLAYLEGHEGEGGEKKKGNRYPGSGLGRGVDQLDAATEASQWASRAERRWEIWSEKGDKTRQRLLVEVVMRLCFPFWKLKVPCHLPGSSGLAPG